MKKAEKMELYKILISNHKMKRMYEKNRNKEQGQQTKNSKTWERH